MGPRILIQRAAKSPLPRPVRGGYREWKYAVSSWSYLPAPREDLAADIFEVMCQRRTRREFAGLGAQGISELLWFTSKIRQHELRTGSRWEHRPVPSAGGCHPIDVLLQPWPSKSERLYLYEPRSHALGLLELRSVADLASAGMEAIAATTASGRGMILWHAAQFRRTFSKYSEGASLVLRDAGVLVGATCIVAEGLGLACCPVGITGEPFLSRALGSGSHSVGVGGCLVGGKALEGL